MEYFIVTYRVTVDGHEKFSGDVGIAGTRKECSVRIVDSVSSAYSELYPEASVILIHILGKLQITAIEFDEFLKLGDKIRKQKGQA